MNQLNILTQKYIKDECCNLMIDNFEPESKIVLYGAVISIFDFLNVGIFNMSHTIFDLPTLGDTYTIPL